MAAPNPQPPATAPGPANAPANPPANPNAQNFMGAPLLFSDILKQETMKAVSDHLLFTNTRGDISLLVQTHGLRSTRDIVDSLKTNTDQVRMLGTLLHDPQHKEILEWGIYNLVRCSKMCDGEGEPVRLREPDGKNVFEGKLDEYFGESKLH